MNTGKTLFAQLMDFLPWTTFVRYVARYGGDEFAVLLVDAGDDLTLAAIVAKIAHAVALPINLGHCHVRVGCSIGVAVYPDDGADPHSLLIHADQRMYGAKRGEL